MPSPLIVTAKFRGNAPVLHKAGNRRPRSFSIYPSSRRQGELIDVLDEGIHAADELGRLFVGASDAFTVASSLASGHGIAHVPAEAVVYERQRRFGDHFPIEPGHRIRRILYLEVHG